MKGGREKVVCNQHRGGDIMTEMKREYWEGSYTGWPKKVSHYQMSKKSF